MRVIHCFRSPVGGLFRHVADLSRFQAAQGYRVALLYDDSRTPFTLGETLMRELRTACSLGLHTIRVARYPGLGDVRTMRRALSICEALRPQIIHGHGAKGGAIARLIGRKMNIPSVYAPHGGSLHYNWGPTPGGMFLASEKWLLPNPSAFHFVCEYEQQQYLRKIGRIAKPRVVAHNGLWRSEYRATTDAKRGKELADLVYIGELRKLKGLDVLLQALALVETPRRPTLVVAGDGPQRRAYERLSRTLGLSERVRFLGHKDVAVPRDLGRVLVVPSRLEAFPYVVLEGIASRIPVLASDVGGIPEMLDRTCLVPPDNPKWLAGRISTTLSDLPQARRQADDRALAAAKRLTVVNMAEKIDWLYEQIGVTGAVGYTHPGSGG